MATCSTINFPSTDPKCGDVDNILLGKILQRLNESAGGTVTIGDVSLAVSDLEIGAVELKDGTSDTRAKIRTSDPDPADPGLVVRNIPSGTQAVSGTFFQATQPVSGTFWQATQPVSIAAAVPVTDNGGSLTVDGTVAVSNFPATQVISGSVSVTNFPAALSVVGGGVEATALRVTIASDSTGVLSVDDNGGSLTVDGSVSVSNFPAALSVVGGGVEATALRVTIASDSTGVLSVDDNGGSLTVDGSVSVSNFPASQAVTNAGMFAVQATLAAETTKVIGTVNQGTSPWVVSGTITSTPSGTQDVNVAKINGVTPLMGAGNTGTGSHRVTIASDNAQLSVKGVAGAFTAGAFATGTFAAGSFASGSVASGAFAASSISTSAMADGASVTFGTKSDAATFTTDSTAVSAMGVLKGILANLQTPLAVNVSKINGVTPLMGSGIMGTGSPRVTIASDNDALTVKQATGTNLHVVLDTTSTTAVTQATAANLNATVVGTGTFVVQATLAAETTKVIGTVNQGTSPWVISGAVTNAGTFVVQENGAALTSLQLIDDVVTVQGTALGSTKTILIGGSVTTAAPTFTTGQINQLSLTTSGALRVDLGATSANATAIKVDGSAVTQPVSGTLTTTESAPTTIFNGKTTVTVAGTRVVLAASTTVKSVTIKALVANTGTIYVGNATVAAANGHALAAGDSTSMDIANLNTVNIDSSVSGEGVTYLAVN